MTTWLLTGGADADGDLAPIEGSPVTLTVDGDRVAGRAACNHYFGPLTVTGDAWSVGLVGQTMMPCDDATMELESRFLRGVQAVDRAAEDAGGLVLTGPGLELRFARAPDDERT